MKKILGLILILILSVFCLVGCKDDEIKNPDPVEITSQITMSAKDDDTEITQIIEGAKIEINSGDIISGDVSTSGESISGDSVGEMGLYSTEDRLVFNLGNVYYLIYEFEGEEIKNFSYCYVYADEEAGKVAYDYFEEATKSEETMEDENMKDIKEVRREGKYIIVSMKENMYADLKKQDVKEAYKYLEQMYKE